MPSDLFYRLRFGQAVTRWRASKVDPTVALRHE
jgi:hypothetical protein